MTENPWSAVDPEFRKRWGLAEDDPGPTSLEKMQFPEDRARAIEAQQFAAAQNGYALTDRNSIPSPGLSQAELDRKLDASTDRAKLRQRDFFSIPAADNRIELFLKSLPGAQNDTKAHIPGAQAFGNFQFGAEAAAAGLSEEEALGWARLAQGVQNVFEGKWPTGRDNPGDPELIRRGYRYYFQRQAR